jgi:hypothetical protein
MKMWMLAFWVVMLCGLVDINVSEKYTACNFRVGLVGRY